MKKGLEPHEFESILLSKLSNMFKGQNRVVNKRMKETAVQLRKDVCIRENRARSGWDKRFRRASEKHVEHGTLPNQHETIEQIKKRTGVSGKRRFDGLLIKLYHFEQHLLFSKDELLGEELRQLTPPKYVVESKQQQAVAPQQNKTVMKTEVVLDIFPKQQQAVASQQNEILVKHVMVHNTIPEQQQAVAPQQNETIV